MVIRTARAEDAQAICDVHVAAIRGVCAAHYEAADPRQGEWSATLPRLACVFRMRPAFSYVTHGEGSGDAGV